MAAAYNPDKSPPTLTSDSNYEDWKRLVKLWSGFTSLPKEKHGLSVLFSLKTSDKEAVLEMVPDEQINSADGLTKVLDQLDSLYLKDITLQKYNALEDFDNYRRPPSTPINEYLHEFEKRYNKIKIMAAQCQMTFLVSAS